MQHSTGIMQCGTSAHNQCKTRNQKTNVCTTPQTLSLSLSLLSLFCFFSFCSQEMAKLIAEAGGESISSFTAPVIIKLIFPLDIELQVTMVECLFRLTSIKERSSLAQKWYRRSPALLKAFTALRDSEFEVVYYTCT